MVADVYTEHAQEVFSACYAPSGFYICSGGMIAVYSSSYKFPSIKWCVEIILGNWYSFKLDVLLT